MDSPLTGHPEVSSKKTYVKPCLRVYGAIETITRFNAQTHTSGDNARKSNGRTGG